MRSCAFDVMVHAVRFAGGIWMSLWFETRNTRHIVAVVGALALGFTACAKPVEVGPNEPMQQGAASVTVTGYSLVHIDLETPTGAVAMTRPVLKLDLDITATGETPVRWNPGFDANAATQAQNVLLFSAPSWENGLSPANNIGAVATGTHVYLDDPIVEAVDIAPGQTVKDVLLFSAPPSSANNLVLSIPPQTFGEDIKFPGYISLPYSASEAEPRPVAELNEDVEAREFRFKATGVDIVYQALKSADGKEAVSRDPLLRVKFTVTNTSDTPIEYIPTRQSSGVDYPALTDQNGAIQNRATFAAGVDVVGQVRERQTIAPGKSIKDFILFDRPTRGVETLHLLYPGRRLGGTGLVRVQFPYTWANPEIPDDFKPKP